MKKQLRRVLVLLLAFTMCFGSAVTLFAADAGTAECPAVHTKDNCEYEAEEVVAPLCGTEGYTIYACKACHTHFIDDVTPALGGCKEFKVVAEVPATCAKAGVMAHEECVVCGKIRLNGKEENNGQIEVKEKDNWVLKSVDEALKIDATGKHVWGEWTDTATGKTRKCTVCGTPDATHEHEFEIVSIDVAPDKAMNNPGKATATCKTCGATHEVDVWADHDCAAKDAKDNYLYLTKVEAKEATCTEEGNKEYWVCKCGKKYASAADASDEKKALSDKAFAALTIPSNHTSIINAHTAKGHTIANYTNKDEHQRIDPTCTQYGAEIIVCPTCGEILKSDSIAKLGHKYKTVGAKVKDAYGTLNGNVLKVVYPTCETDGFEQRYCTNCSQDIYTTLPKTGHNYVKVTVAANCANPEFTFYYCTNKNCDYAATDKIEKTVTIGEATYNLYYQFEKAVNFVDDAEGEYALKVTEGSKPNAKNHELLKFEITKAATCEANGIRTENCLCSGEAHVTNTVTIPATGHNVVKTGKTAKIVDSKDATCTSTGFVTYGCINANCTYTETEITSKVVAQSEYTITAKFTLDDIKALHGGEANLTVLKVENAPECGGKKVTYYYCNACEASFTVVENIAVKHTQPATFDKNRGEKAATAATCTTPAYTAQYYCTVCNEFVAATAVGKASGHTIGSKITKAKAATCEEIGYKANSYYCSTCKHYVASKAANAASMEIPALGHNYYKLASKANSCTADGYDTKLISANETVYGCKNCKSVFTAKTVSGKTTYTKITDKTYDDGIVAKTNHSGTTVPVSVVSACETVGYTYNRCTKCGYDYVDGYSLPTGHHLVAVKAKANSCTADGYTAHKACDNKGCEYTEGKTIIPAAHKDAKGSFTECEAAGRTCTVCKKSFKEDVHDAKLSEEVKATCTNAGYKIYACSKCGKILTDKTVLEEKLTHNPVMVKVIVPATTVAEGKALYECPLCHETEERVLPKLSDLELNITADNAVVAGATIVESGKVKVTVSISSLDSDIWGTNFSVNYAATMFRFDSAKVITENFQTQANAVKVDVKDAKGNVIGEKETGEVKVVAIANNDEAGNPQNVKLAGTETLVELYFTVVGNAAKDQKFEIFEPSAGDLDGNKEIKASGAATVDVAQIADVDGVAGINVNDLSALLRLYRNEEYNAAADLDKDGEITALDFALLMNYLSGFATMEDIRAAQ